MSARTTLLRTIRHIGGKTPITAPPEYNRAEQHQSAEPEIKIIQNWLCYQIDASWLGGSLRLYNKDKTLIWAIRIEAMTGKIMLPSIDKHRYTALIEKDLMQFETQLS